MKTVKANLTIQLETTHSIDSSSRESQTSNVVARQIKDSNYGGHGERVTSVPTVQNVTIQNATSSQYESMASDAIGGEETYEVGDLQLVKLTQTSIKGVK